jgi:hypothetical protein
MNTPRLVAALLARGRDGHRVVLDWLSQLTGGSCSSIRLVNELGMDRATEVVVALSDAGLIRVVGPESGLPAKLQLRGESATHRWELPT